VAKGISIAIAADARAVTSAVQRDVLKPLEETVEALDRVERAGANLDLEDSMRDAQRQTEELSDETKQLREHIERAGRAGRDAGVDIKRGTDDARDGFDRAKRGVDDFRDEANSTAREAAASFDGSAESIGDAFQEVAANAFAGFGPAGAVAGLAAAAGLGFALSAITEQQEAADELRERLSGMYQSAVEEGRAYLDQAQIIAEVQSLMFNPDRADEYLRVQEQARLIGVDIATYAAALAGDEQALNVALELGNAKRQTRQDWAERNLIAERETGVITDAQGSAMDTVLSKLQERQALTEQNKAAAEAATEVTEQLGERERENIRRTRDADAARWQAFVEAAEASKARVVSPMHIPLRVDDTQLTNVENRVRSLSGRVISVRREGQTGAGRLIL
jgi:hypothetical protein